MSKLIYLVRRRGERGLLGEIKDAIQCVENSPIVEFLTNPENEQWYHEGTAEEYEEYTHAMAGDIDGDGDVDEDDEALSDELRA
ncbi:MAG: hypothetical protein ABIH47_00225 [Candidatus Omnitrophota bacterium]